MESRMNVTMGKMISALRKEQGMTQAELAEKMNVTDKAVSKWERDLSCPDVNSLPRLAELFGISVDELMQVKNASGGKNEENSMGKTVDLVLKAVTVAMGVSVVVLSILGNLDMDTGFKLLGLGLLSVGIVQLKNQNS